MTPTPVVYDLEPLDAEPRCDLGCAYELIYVDAATHSCILPHSAYMLTHPQLREAATAVSGCEVLLSLLPRRA